MNGDMSCMRVVVAKLRQQHGCEPTLKTTAAAGLSLHKTRMILNTSRQTLSANQQAGIYDGDFLECLEDHRQEAPLRESDQQTIQSRLNSALDVLNDREREVLRLRYGLVDGCAHTLEKIGKKFSITRERVRQIEVKAMHKLQHPRLRRDLLVLVD